MLGSFFVVLCCSFACVEHFCFPLIASAFVDPAKLGSFYQELITPLIKCPVKVLDLMQPPRKHIVK